MQKPLSVLAVAALAAFGASAQAQEINARVVAVTPIVQQVQVPCNNPPIAVPPPATGVGAFLGAVTGGLLGSLVGGGMGTVVATGLGMVGGAAVGDRVERSGPPMMIAQGCGNQPYAENRTVGYNVTYEYNGVQQTVQMANDPGPTVRLQLAPAGAMAQSNSYPQPNGYPQQSNAYPQPNRYPQQQPYAYPPSGAYPYPSASGYPSGSGEVQTSPGGTVSVGPNSVYPAYPAPSYGYAPGYGYPAAYPAAYYPGYALPIALSLGFGYTYGGHSHGHGYRGGYYRR